MKDNISVEFTDEEINYILDYPSIAMGENIRNKIRNMMIELNCLRLGSMSELANYFTKNEAQLICTTLEYYYENNIALLPHSNMIFNSRKLFTESICDTFSVNREVILDKINNLTEAQSYTLITFIADYHKNKTTKSIDEIFISFENQKKIG